MILGLDIQSAIVAGGIFIYCTFFMTLFSKFIGANYWQKYLQRKWISHTLAASIIIYMVVKNGVYFDKAGGVITLIVLGAIMIVWNFFEHIGDNQKAYIELKLGRNKSIKVGGVESKPKKIRDGK